MRLGVEFSPSFAADPPIFLMPAEAGHRLYPLVGGGDAATIRYVEYRWGMEIAGRAND